MKRLITTLTLVLASVLFPSHATIISINPQSPTATVGEQLTVDLSISGLGHNTADSLSTFDIDFLFDSNILQFQNASFGTQLDLFGFGSWNNAEELSSGVVNLFELSFDSATDLDSMQSGSFVLASLVFDVIANGATNLSTQINALGDANGLALTNVELQSKNIAVPTPSITLLMALGLIGLIASRKTPKKY